MGQGKERDSDRSVVDTGSQVRPAVSSLVSNSFISAFLLVHNFSLTILLCSVCSSLYRNVMMVSLLLSLLGLCRYVLSLLVSSRYMHSNKKCSMSSTSSPHNLHLLSLLFLSQRYKQFVLDLNHRSAFLLFSYSSSCFTFFVYSIIF